MIGIIPLSAWLIAEHQIKGSKMTDIEKYQAVIDYWNNLVLKILPIPLAFPNSIPVNLFRNQLNKTPCFVREAKRLVSSD